MYTVMIVDDEMLVRLMLRSFLDHSDFNVIAEAAGGREAMSVYHKIGSVDLLLTDISMPAGDGLSFIEQVLACPNPPIVVVLSAYNDFAYVRRAFQLGAADYVLKSEIDREVMLSFLKRIVQQANLHARSAAYRLEKDVVLKAVLDQILPANTPQLAEAGVRLFHNTLCAFLSIDDFTDIQVSHNAEELIDLKQNVAATIDEVLRPVRGCAFLALTPQEYILLLSADVPGGRALQDKVNQVLSQLRYCLKVYCNVTISVGLSRAGSSSELPALYQEAQFNTRLRFIFGKSKTIYPEQARLVTSEQDFMVLDLAEGLVSAMDAGNEQASAAELDTLLCSINEKMGARLQKAHMVYSQVVFLLMKYLHDKGATVEGVFGRDVDFYSRMEQFETRQEIRNWLLNLTRAIAAYVKECSCAQPHDFVADAQEFIRKNYAESISLKTISDYVGFSESYFSAQFIKTTGESFTDYLINVRMKKAKELLAATDLLTYEISQQVGYANVEHFSRMFKKHTGITPGQYRVRAKRGRPSLSL